MQLEFALDTVSGTTSTTFDLHSFARHLLKNNKKHSILRMRWRDVHVRLKCTRMINDLLTVHYVYT